MHLKHTGEIIAVFLVSTVVSGKRARWSCLTVWERNTLRRCLKNLGWHRQVHILFVEQYALCIEFQLKTWVNKSNARTHTQNCVCMTHIHINKDKRRMVPKGSVNHVRPVDVKDAVDSSGWWRCVTDVHSHLLINTLWEHAWSKLRQLMCCISKFKLL